LVGTRIYNQKTGEFNTSVGPVFTNLLLADEINRAPAKVQSALLEAMQERQVTIGRETFKLPAPFLVLATQNPIETEGTYPLPEAQVDRFMMKVLVDYPQRRGLSSSTGLPALPRSSWPWPRPSNRRASGQCRPVRGPRADSVRRAPRLCDARSRPPRPGRACAVHLLWRKPSGLHSSHRGCPGLAYLRGRDCVLPEDVTDLVPDVFRHRLVLSTRPWPMP
jgi:MoxR-like ATPase